MIKRIHKAIIHAENIAWAKISSKKFRENVEFLIGVITFGKIVLQLSYSWLDIVLATYSLYKMTRKRFDPDE